MVNTIYNSLKTMSSNIAKCLKRYASFYKWHLSHGRYFFHVVAWVNILCQLLCPISLAFSPAIAATMMNQQTITATEPYVLGPNDNVSIIAQKFHITLDQLKKLNQFRSFAKPFNQLTVGDEIDVPMNVRNFSVDNASVNDAAAKPDIMDRLLSGNAQSNGAKNNADQQVNQNGFNRLFSGPTTLNSNAGNFGAQTNLVGTRADEDQNGDAAREMVRSAATGELGQSLQQWLSQFGTARVQLNVNSNSSLGSSALDLLIPLYDKPSDMFFTQWGIRDNDGRATLNIGGGSRFWRGGWMLGMNSFFDDDLTGDNRRVGIGVEAWRDYLKLSANSYIRTSNWQDSRDFADYLERPANGYDIRAQAYLPSYPQLGGNLMFEQYYGENVGLFGKDNLQKNPYAVTLGVNYTPISLLTVGVDYRQGKGNMNDTSLNLQMNYRLGASWQSQTSADGVAALRTLAGTRYDLVNRNNDIVLDYQKLQVIELRLPAHLTGYEAEQITVTAQVTSKYALDHINWDTSAIAAAGGTVSQPTINTLLITLPPYQHSDSATNLYNIGAVAYDVKQNASNTAAATIEVLPIAATITAANLIVTANNAPANGIAANAVQAKVTDGANTPVAGQTVTFSAANGAKVTTVISTTGTDGLATATLTNITAGNSVVTATLNGNSRSVTTTFIADAATAHIASLAATTDNALANGLAANAVQATVTDLYGNPVANETVTFTATNGAVVTTVIGTTRTDGVATATLTSINVGSSTVTATLANGKDGAVNILFVIDTASIHVASLNVTKNDALADGINSNAVEATITDAKNHPASGEVVQFTATNGATITTIIGTTGADGIATATLTNTMAGNSNVTARLTNGSSREATTIFIADAATAHIATLSATTDGSPADGETYNEVMALVTDAHNNPLTGQVVNFTANNGAIVTTVIGTTGANGIATATLTSTIVGESTVTATLSNGKDDTVNIHFVIDAASIHVDSLDVTVDGSPANGETANAVRALIADATHHPASGEVVQFSATNGAIVTTIIGTTGADGIATATLTNTTAGASFVTAKLDNGRDATKETLFIADVATARVASMEATANNALANGSAANAVQATVTDLHGNPIAGQVVTFTASNGALVTTVIGTTGANGIATATLTSTIVGPSTVTATLTNGKDDTVNIEFTIDTDTIHVASLVTIVDESPANGAAENVVEAKITDNNNIPASGEQVKFSVTNGAIITPVSGTTGSDGVITARLTNIRAGDSIVTASLDNGSSRDVTTHFIADVATARIASLVATANDALANGIAINAVQATVTDAHGNILIGQIVAFGATNGATISTTGGTTGGSGTATATLSSFNAGESLVTASLANGSNQTVPINFLLDTVSATITATNLTVTENNAPADGATFNTVRAVVTNAAGQILPNQVVTFTATNSATVLREEVTTDSDGVAITNLTSRTVGASEVTARLANGFSRSVSVEFVTPVVLASLAVTEDSATANGLETNIARVKVTDTHGNPMSGVVVTLATTATAGTFSVVTPAGTTTNAEGNIDFQYTYTLAQSIEIKAAIPDTTQSLTESGGTFTVPTITTTILGDGYSFDGTPALARATFKTARGLPLVDTEFRVAILKYNGATYIPFTSPVVDPEFVTTDSAGQVMVSATSLVAGDSLIWAFYADSINGGINFYTNTGQKFEFF
jgi:adhesin/invasin